MFAREVNESEVMKSALEHAILIQVDCEKGEGPAIAKRYGVGGYPSFFAVNGDGEVTDSALGYDGPDAWAGFVEAAAADRRTIPEKTAAYERAPTGPLARSLGNAAATSYDFAGAVGYFETARELDPANADEYTQLILSNMYNGGAESFDFDAVEAEVAPLLAAEEADTSDRFQLVGMLVEFAKAGGAPSRAASYLESAMALEIDPADESLAEMRAGLAVDAALILDKDPERAVALMKAGLPEDWLESTRQLHGFAWWCFQNEVNLDEALALTLKSRDLAGDDKTRATSLRIAAEICSVRGEDAEAVDHMQRAVELNPGRQSYKRRLEAFEEQLKERGRD